MFGEFLTRNEANLKAEFYLPAAVNTLIQEGQARVKVLPTESNWFGVTYREDRAVCHREHSGAGSRGRVSATALGLNYLMLERLVSDDSHSKAQNPS